MDYIKAGANTNPVDYDILNDAIYSSADNHLQQSIIQGSHVFGDLYKKAPKFNMAGPLDPVDTSLVTQAGADAVDNLQDDDD